MRRLLLLLAIVVALDGCSGCGQIAPTDGGVDAPSDALTSDVASGDGSPAETGVCDPNRPILPQTENCDAKLNAICQQWAQQAAGSAYGYSMCEDTNTGIRDCGDPDCNGSCCGTDPFCGIGQVCASDTPNGPRHCIQACSGL